MGFAVVNILGFENIPALWPLLAIYGGIAMAVAVRWAVTKERPLLFATATVFGLGVGTFVGNLTTSSPTRPEVTMTSAPWAVAVAQATNRVDRNKERLAEYIDENLPHIPEVLHAHCREIQDALAARGLLCVDVGPNAARKPARGEHDRRAFALWEAYRAAQADLDRLKQDTL